MENFLGQVLKHECIKIFLILPDIPTKCFASEKVLAMYLEDWGLYNPSINLYYLNYFIPGYSGILCIKRVETFNLISKFYFQNLLYPFQNFLSSSEIHYNQGWIFKTRKPLYRISGWPIYLSNILYLKPFSVTLNLKSVKSVTWCLFKPFKSTVYPAAHYRSKLINNKAKVIMPRLFGFEFPKCQLNYYDLLLDSRFYLGICFKYFNYSRNNFPFFNDLENNFLFKKNFPEIQFYFLTFRYQMNLMVSKIRNSQLNQLNSMWYSLFKFQTHLTILNSQSSRIQSLLTYGKTLTLGTPIACISTLCTNGGEINLYKKTTNLINNNHIFSYSRIKTKQNAFLSLGSLFYMGKNYKSEYFSSNGILFDCTETN